MSTRRRKGKGKGKGGGGGGLKLKEKEKNKYTETQPVTSSPRTTPPLSKSPQPRVPSPPSPRPTIQSTTPSHIQPFPVHTPSHDQSPNITVLYDYHQSFDAADLEGPVQPIEELAAMFKDSPTAASPQPRRSFGFTLWRDADSPTLPATKRMKCSISPLTAKESEGTHRLHALASQLQQRINRQKDVRLSDCKMRLQLDEEPPTLSEPTTTGESEGTSGSPLVPPPPRSPNNLTNPLLLPGATAMFKDRDTEASSQASLLSSPPRNKPSDPLDVLFGVCDQGGVGEGEAQQPERGELVKSKLCRAPPTSGGHSTQLVTGSLMVQSCVGNSSTIDTQAAVQAQVMAPSKPHSDCQLSSPTSKHCRSRPYPADSTANASISHSLSQPCVISSAVCTVTVREERAHALSKGEEEEEEEEEGEFWSQAAELVTSTWENKDVKEKSAESKDNIYEDTMSDAFIDQLLFSGLHTGTTPTPKQMMSSSGSCNKAAVSCSNSDHLSATNHSSALRLLRNNSAPISHTCGSRPLTTIIGALPVRASSAHTSTQGVYGTSQRGPTANSSFVNKNRVRLIPGAIGPPTANTPSSGNAMRKSGVVGAQVYREPPAKADVSVGQRREGGHTRCSQVEIERKREQAKLRLSQKLRRGGTTVPPNL